MADVQRWNCSADEYYASERISNSGLGAFLASPADFGEGIKRPETEALRWGRLVHLRVLEPSEYRRRVQIDRRGKINRRTNAGKAEHARAQAEIEDLSAAGFLVVSEAEADCLDAITYALSEHDEARTLITKCEREVAYTWTDEATGLACRARLDLHRRRRQPVVADLKTTDNPSPVAFGKSVGKYGYLRQAAFYSRPIRELTGEEPLFYFIAVRSTGRHEVAVHPVDPAHIAAGDRQIDAALAELATCIETKRWIAPWQAHAERYLPIPRWALQVNS